MIEKAPRLFITGTDTDVGKTRVVAAAALALRRWLPLETPVTIVKAVQTGLDERQTGDAVRAAAEARAHLPEARGARLYERELRRYRKPSDAYSAALDEGQAVRCAELAAEVESIPGALVVEGLGGAAVPLDDCTTIAQLAAEARLATVVVVGLRLGCINHSLLTAHYLRALGCEIAGAVLVERWMQYDAGGRADVVRSVSKELPVLAVLPYDPGAQALTAAADQLEEVLCNRHAQKS